MIYRKSGTLPASLCDAGSRLSLLGLFDLVEDAITDLMGDLGIDGLSTLKNYRALWVISRHKVRLHDRPRWREPYCLAACLSLHSAVRIAIDTCLNTPDGRPFAEARSELCALSLDTMRPQKVTQVGVREEMMVPTETAFSFSRPDLLPGTPVEEVRIRSTSIDYGHHTNNIEYLRLLLNRFSAEELSARPPREIQLDFYAQSFEGDRLTLTEKGTPEARRFLLLKEEKPTVAAEFLF